jgi:oxygen-dependent protoporphyrinogen oxidase
VKRVVVVGAGISGLAAARVIADARERVEGGLEIVVLERDPWPGGKVRTHREDGWLVEEGPTGFLDNEPAVDRLVDAAGLTKLPAQKSSARRFLVGGGRMREIQAHPLKFATAGLLGPLGLLRIAAEPFVAGKRDDADESVWHFARRRLGPQAADRLIAPMVLGVFAGDAKRLSLPASFPKMAAMESEHGSLVKAMLAKRRAGTSGGGPAGPAGWLTSFESGLAALPETLARSGDFDVRTSRPAEALRREPDGRLRVVLDDAEDLVADAVVLAGEPWAMAPLVGGVDDEAARELAAIACPPVAVVALGFEGPATEQVPRGFGVLIPRGEGFRILGCLWDSMIFPARAARGRVLVRAMLGGSVDEAVGGLDDDELVRIAREDLARLLGVTDAPVFRRVVMWDRAIPQYELGHRARVARIEERIAAQPGLFVAGNALDGIAFGKAAARGVSMGEAAARFLAGEGA